MNGLPPGMAMPEVRKGDRIIGFGGAGSRSQFEVAWANNRWLAHRPPAVVAGDRVFYRSNDWLEMADAVIVAVLWDDTEEPSLYGPDPWPWVILRIDPDRIPASWDKRQRSLARLDIKTKEARLKGSAGYLHSAWSVYPQPDCGAGGM